MPSPQPTAPFDPADVPEPPRPRLDAPQGGLRIGPARGSRRDLAMAGAVAATFCVTAILAARSGSMDAFGLAMFLVIGTMTAGLVVAVVLGARSRDRTAVDWFTLDRDAAEFALPATTDARFAVRDLRRVEYVEQYVNGDVEGELRFVLAAGEGERRMRVIRARAVDLRPMLPTLAARLNVPIDDRRLAPPNGRHVGAQDAT